MSAGDDSAALVAICCLNPELADFREMLRRVKLTDHEALVVDMSPGEDVRRVCEELGVRCDRFVESRGLSDSRNRALATTTNEHVVFLDSDAFPEGDWVAPMVARLHAEDDVAIVAARVFAAWESRPPRLFKAWTAGTWMSLFDLGPDPIDVPRAVGTSFALARSRVPRHGFDVELGLSPTNPLGGEEIKFCVETRAMGYRIVYEPQSVVRHRVSAERGSWGFMLTRAYKAGREQQAHGTAEPLPRSREFDDHVFKLAIAPAFLTGRARAALDGLSFGRRSTR